MAKAGCPAGGAGREMRVSKSGRASWWGTAPPYPSEVTTGIWTPATAWEAGERPRGPDRALQGGHKGPHVMHGTLRKPLG